MSILPTAHISAKENDIAKTVLMPGDPLRAKYIAENFLDNVKCFNTVRNMLGFTGKYKGKEVSVMGSGMGIPSIGIYSYELYNFYGVENIIRIGSAGAISDDVDLRDVVIGMGACTNSGYASQYNLIGTFAPIADYGLVERAKSAADNLKISVKVGNILSSDTFYDDDNEYLLKWKKMGVLAVEMESAGLYMNAARCGKKALCILTISDCPLKGTSLSSDERQCGFKNMMNTALETI